MEKRLPARQFAVIPRSAPHRGRGIQNNILNQEVGFYVFLLGQASRSTDSGLRRFRVRSLRAMEKAMEKLACFQYLSGETSARMFPIHAERKQDWI
jgi:hypothetical protein